MNIESKIQKSCHFTFEESSKVLLVILEKRLPKSANVYNMCKNYDSFKKPDEMAFYTLHTSSIKPADASKNEPISHESVWILGTCYREDYGRRYLISAPEFAKATPEIRNALIHCAYINWNEKYCFSCIDFLISPLIYEISTIVKGNSVTCSPCKIYYIDREQAENLEIPELSRNGDDFIIKPLDTKQGIDFFAKTWKFSVPGKTEVALEALLSKNMSLGVYDKREHVVCGMSVNDCGLLGMLYTLEEFRGKGLAKFVTKQLIKSFAKDFGGAPCSAVEMRNQISAAFHEKLGMKVSHGADWIKYVPTTW